MNLGQAIEAIKKGYRCTRENWNGRDQYIELASKLSYINGKGDTINADHSCIGNSAVAFVGTHGIQIGWLASQADLLAEDWKIV